MKDWCYVFVYFQGGKILLKRFLFGVVYVKMLMICKE